MPTFKVYAERCAQCLFSKDKIVSDERRKDLLAHIKDTGRWFECHKASLRDERICCKGFYDSGASKDVELARQLGLIEFVPLPDAPIEGAKDSDNGSREPQADDSADGL